MTEAIPPFGSGDGDGSMPFPASAGVKGLNGRTLCISTRHAFGYVPYVLSKGIDSFLASTPTLSLCSRLERPLAKIARVLWSFYLPFVRDTFSCAGGDPHRRRATHPNTVTPTREKNPRTDEEEKKWKLGTHVRERSPSLRVGGGEGRRTERPSPPSGRNLIASRTR